MKRRELRDNVFKLTFAIIANEEFPYSSLDYYFDDNEINEDDSNYIKNEIKSIFDNLQSIDDIIAENIKGYSFNRLSKVILTALRVGVYEIGFNDDIPNNVAISEIMQIVELYEDEKAKSYVNGVLGTYVRSLVQKEPETISDEQ